MHADRSRIEARIDRVLDERVRPAQYTAAVPLELSAWPVDGEPVPVEDALAASYEPFATGSAWGRPWSTTWFRAVGKVPAEWVGRQVEAVFDPGFTGAHPGFQAEALAYTPSGVPVKAVNPRNRYVPVPASDVGGEVAWLLEAAGNPDVGGAAGGVDRADIGSRDSMGGPPLYRFVRADLAVLDPEVYGLTLDMDVLRELMHALHEDDSRRAEIRVALDRACDAVDLDDVAGSAAAARAELAGVLARRADASAHTVHAVGHAHIDTAWLWPMRETERKVERTFSNVVALAGTEPDLVFACSQAQQYAWVRDRWPETYKGMQTAATSGSWYPVGGMWVESDGNLPGGEALARQFVHGQRYFLDEFGAPCTGAWLPDSFGYTAAYPQLATLAGLEWFLTQKISWNKTNRFPHHTFWWEGIDGTRIFTHFPPVDTYNAEVSGAELLHSVRNHADAGRATHSLLPYGYGDGGGGPTREMLERIRRFADLEGAPRVVHSTPDAFFAAARAEYPDAPVWSGELYLEMHRGTYTTQARGKAGNRRSEHLLREAELWATAAAVHLGTPYPYETLDRLWKHVLLLQFHDILPGSSIHWVHEEANADYARITAELDELIGASQQALAGPDGTVFSASPRARTAVVTDGGGPTLVALPPSAAVPLSAAAAAGRSSAAAPVTVSGTAAGGDLVLDNGLVRVAVDADGLLSSVRDLRVEREVLAPGSRGNLLRLHTDLPNTYDAWDVDRHYLNRFVDLTDAESVTVTATGPLAASVVVARAFGRSRVEQTLTLTSGDPGLRVTTVTDWHEREKFLKAGFVLDVRSPRSTAEIQFGHIERPTHANTSWDHARFEVSAHRWVHVGEAGYGVALLTDATYGYDASSVARIQDGGTQAGGTTTTVRLSLLRAPLTPDPEADQGRHVQTYTLLPGADVAAAAAGGYALNLPPRLVTGSAAADVVPATPLVDTDGNAVVVEAVKLADDRSGDVVVRLYESLGGHARTRLRAAFPVTAATSEDLLERPLAGAETLEVDVDGTVGLTLRPFQVLTVRLRRRSD